MSTALPSTSGNTNDADASQMRPAVCPRCRYDLSGTTRQWTDRCPLEGQCNECGLEFDWRQVYILTEHPWLFEYHWRQRPATRLVRTIWRSLRPWSFWRDVKMSDPIYLKPAAVVWLLCLVIGLFAGLAAIVSSRHAMFSGWGGGNRASTWAYWEPLIVEAAQDAPTIVWMRVSGALFTLVGMPIVFALLPATLRRGRVRPAHLLRIWMYSLSFLTVLAIIWLAMEAVCDWLGLQRVQDIIDPWRWYRSTWSRPGEPFLHAFVPGAVVAAVSTVWMVCFWYWAVKRYLKLPHAAGICLLLGVIVFCIAIFVEMPKWWTGSS